MISYYFVKKPRVLVKNKRVKVQKKTITTSLKQKHKAALQIKKGNNIAVDPADPVIFRASPAVSTQNIHTPECHTTQSTETLKAKTSDSGKKNTPSALNSMLLLV